jgi:hypothetical protein
VSGENIFGHVRPVKGQGLSASAYDFGKAPDATWPVHSIFTQTWGMAHFSAGIASDIYSERLLYGLLDFLSFNRDIQSRGSTRCFYAKRMRMMRKTATGVRGQV